MSVRTSIALKVIAESNPTPVAPCVRPVYAASIAFAENDVVWLTSGETIAELPSGASTLAARIRQPNIGGTSLNESEFTTTIGNCTIEVVDINGTWTEFVQTKRLQNIGSRKAFVQLYEGCVGETLTADNIIASYEWYDDSFHYGVTKLELKEIIYTTKEYVLNASDARLYQSYDTNSTQILLTSVDGSDLKTKFPTFAHHRDYTSEPYFGVEGQGYNPSVPYTSPDQAKNITHEKFGYLYFESTGEIVCHSGLSDHGNNVYRVNVIKRGALGTTALSGSVDSSTKVENRPKVTEIIYAEETGPELICMLLTSTSLNNKRAFPWGLDIPRDKLDIAQFAYLNEQAQPQLVLKTCKKAKSKEFIQEEILPWLGAFLDTRPDGLITLKSLPLALPDSTYIATLNHGNSEVTSALKRDLTNIYNPITIKWGYNEIADSFIFTSENNFLDSTAKYKHAEEKIIESKLLQPGKHTDAAVKSIVERMATYFAFERETISVKALPSMRYLRKGDIVLADFDNVRDAASDLPNDVRLKRPMVIVGKQPESGTRAVTYTLSGHTARPEAISPAGGIGEVTVEELQNSGRTNLNTVITIDGSGNLSGTGTIPPGDYYYPGDLTVTPNTAYTAASNGGKISIWQPSDKFFQDNSGGVWLNLSGKGRHAGGKGATSTTAATPGERGYVGSNTGGGGMRIRIVRHGGGDNVADRCAEWYREVVSLDNGAAVNGLNDSIRALALSRQNGKIIGLPSDLSGSGGSGGGLTHISNRSVDDDINCGAVDITIPGADGNRGGMGFELLTGGLAWSAGSKVNLSGNNAGAASQSGNVYGAHGAGGAPGCMHLILPKGATPPNLTDYVIANSGSGSLSGVRLSSANTTRKTTDPAYRSYYDPTASTNMSVACTLISYIPEESVPEEYAGNFLDTEWNARFDSLQNDLDALAASTVSKNNTVYYSPTQPTSANLYDYWADTSDIDPEGRPTGYQLLDDGWQPVQAQDAYWDLVASNYASMTAAEQARAIADGKIETLFTESADPNDWPPPNGYGDLLYVEPLSVIYRCEDGSTWNTAKPYVDELSMPTSANMLLDPGFAEIAYNNKLTWGKVGFGATVTGTATVEYGAFGDGGSAGAKLTVNGSGSVITVPSKKIFQARRGDMFRFGCMMRSDIAAGDPRVKLILLDASKAPLASLPVPQVFINDVDSSSSLVKFGVFEARYELDSFTFDFSPVQYVQPAIELIHTGSGDNVALFDYVYCERIEAIDSRVEDSNYGFGTSYSTGLERSFDVYNDKDVVDVYYDFSAIAGVSGGNITALIEIYNYDTPAAESTKSVVADQPVLGASDIEERSFSGRFTFSGLSITTLSARLRIKGSVSGYLHDASLEIRIRRSGK